MGNHPSSVGRFLTTSDGSEDLDRFDDLLKGCFLGQLPNCLQGDRFVGHHEPLKVPGGFAADWLAREQPVG
jgi:hypothetical protein